jgi:hypothetical protein
MAVPPQVLGAGIAGLACAVALTKVGGDGDG